MELVFAEPAARDLGLIIDYIAIDDPAAAEKVFRAIMGSMERLRQFPHIGHVGRIKGTRELSVASLPYIAVYRVDTEVVTIVAVFHAARDLARAIRERLGNPD